MRFSKKFDICTPLLCQTVVPFFYINEITSKMKKELNLQESRATRHLTLSTFLLYSLFL